ncbi:hypothetical protein [Bacillus sp. UNC438CL73TsuS30]|uniref:hypothetical protein n=1 Tax=Bacillus sp. UNC438CL73TsuS30 TaxID=1340434 RepID=UPI00047BD061|nr:hypothetical protein [Bacillus sp. UNC438CL73TsuS30]
MKKKILLSGFVAFFVFLSFSLGVWAAPKLSVWFNGKAKKVSVKMINKKAYVPLNDVVSWFGGKVKYDKKSNKYIVTSKDYHPSGTKLKSYNVNAVLQSGPMKMTVSKVTVNPSYKYDQYMPAIKAVVLDVKVQNTSTKKVNWFPVQGIYAFNTGEQIEDAISYSQQVDGEFLGNTTKSGKIVLKVNKSNLDSIKSIQIQVDGPFDDEFNQLGEKVTYNLKFR